MIEQAITNPLEMENFSQKNRIIKSNQIEIIEPKKYNQKF